MKIALVYTSTTPELIELVEKQVRENVGQEAELLSFQDPSILAEIREAGGVTVPAAARLVEMFMEAAKAGADAVLNVCSSVGEVADACQELAGFLDMPIVRIDEEMCREAVRLGERIGVMATLPTTLNPTKNTLLRAAGQMGRKIQLVDGLIDGAFGLGQEEFKALMLEKAQELKSQVDVLLFAQGSMAYCEDLIRERTQKEVVSSPRFGAAALKEALKKKGVIRVDEA